MRSAGELGPSPARERWFWLGVGFVSALGVVLLALALAATLAARGRPKQFVAQQPTPPARHVVKPAPASHPAPPKKPPARVVHRKPPKARVRVVERPVRDTGAASSTGPAPSRPPAPLAPSKPPERPAERTAQNPSSAPNAPPAPDQVAGARQEWPPAPPSGDGDRSQTPPSSAEDRSGATPPRLITSRGADYPTSAMAEGVTGKVRLRLGIGADGFVDHVAVTRSSGDSRLDVAAARAAILWRYRPAQRNGRPVPSTDNAEFEFFHRGGRSRPGSHP